MKITNMQLDRRSFLKAVPCWWYVLTVSTRTLRYSQRGPPHRRR